QKVIMSLQKAPTAAPVEPAAAEAVISASSETPLPVSEKAPAEAPAQTGGLMDKSFVITGTLNNLSYEQVVKLITEAGGRINKMPSGKTDYIVVGRNPGSKLKKAEKYNTPQLNESELLALLDSV
ncbi:MAG: BRCT domain-containing protein, partial [Cyanobacteria bacterium J06626_26]